MSFLSLSTDALSVGQVPLPPMAGETLYVVYPYVAYDGSHPLSAASQ